MSGYRIELASGVQKELDRLPARQVSRIVDAIRRLTDNPRPRGSKKLVGEENLYRIRVGIYRVIYAIFDDELVIVVVRVKHRKDAYD